MVPTCGVWALQRASGVESATFGFLSPNAEAPAAIRQLISPSCQEPNLWAMTFSSNLARKKWRLEGNRETGETVAEETQKAKLLMIQEFPITMKDFS